MANYFLTVAKKTLKFFISFKDISKNCLHGYVVVLGVKILQIDPKLKKCWPSKLLGKQSQEEIKVPNNGAYTGLIFLASLREKAL